MHGRKKGHMGPLEKQEAIAEIASSLPRYFPEGWQSALYHVRIMGSYANQLSEVEKGDGEIAGTELPPGSSMKCMKLRAGMYREGEGTWFSLKLKFWSEGRYRPEFNYDDHPDFLFVPDLREYVREVKLFPRSDEFMPGWLREQINEANSANGN
ncbi:MULTISPECIES: hypothetical protein [unclassified Nocardiopsis]|uniref:hypothetical protein n=1 Tax=unclassified Nocardiopsis TaxID=2649073 RepID=UPI001F5B2230|nr:hypothetical protein [Nocardiopsis sp. TSRI0078]